MKPLLRVATTSTATLEAVNPPYNVVAPDPEETFRRGLELIHSAARQGAELVCLPEAFAHAGIPIGEVSATLQTLDGSWVSQLSGAARSAGIYVVAGSYVEVHNEIRNTALLIDSSGALVTRYDKMHPTEGERKVGVVGGDAPVVVATPLGRLGFSICFDLNWPGDWVTMSDQDAELILFLSAYEGGFPLQALAWQHRIHVASSVYPYHAKIIDPLGRSLGTTSRWSRLVTKSIDLDARIFHIDGQVGDFARLSDDMAGRLNVEALTSEHVVLVTRLDPSVDMDEVIADYGLIELDDYLKRSQAVNQDSGV